MSEGLVQSLVEVLVQAVPVGLFAIRDGQVVWCNEYFCELAELPKEAIVGKHFVGFVAPEDRPFVVDRYTRRLKGEAVPDHYEFSVLGASGRRRPVFMVARIVAADAVRHSIGVVVDFTEQAQLAAGLGPVSSAQPLPATPVLRVAAGVLVVPLVGHYHAARAHQLTQDVLAAIQAQQARALILDVTGLVDADLRIADYLTRAAAATRLLGARCILAGVSPELARTLVAANETIVGLATAATLEDALKMAQAPE